MSKPVIRAILLDLAILLGVIVVLVVIWAIFSFICLAGTCLLLIADPGMTTIEMVRVAMIGGAIATIVGLCAAIGR